MSTAAVALPADRFAGILGNGRGLAAVGTDRRDDGLPPCLGPQEDTILRVLRDIATLTPQQLAAMTGLKRAAAKASVSLAQSMAVAGPQAGGSYRWAWGRIDLHARRLGMSARQRDWLRWGVLGLAVAHRLDTGTYQELTAGLRAAGLL